MHSRTQIHVLFFITCLVITVPGIFSDEYYRLFSSEESRTHWWNYFMMPFQHGQVNAPSAIIIHLCLNMALLLTVGRWTEMLLGPARFVILTLSAWTTFILVQWSSGIWINGSSGIIWAYSPFLLALQHTPGKQFHSARELARPMMWIMWVVVTVVMTFIPLLFNPEHSLVHTAVFGNLYHLTATITGFVYLIFWKNKYL